MAKYDRSLRKALNACRTEEISECGLTLNAVQGLQGNPAGVSKGDQANPDYKGKVTTKGDQLHIRLTYVLTGNIDRAAQGLKNIQKIFKRGGINVEFTPNLGMHDLRIHGAHLAEFTQGLKLCDCEAALFIGGWAPSHRHLKWGKALLLNPLSPKETWEMTDAHEFAHKLGLKHRRDLGLMDYPPKAGKDRRRFLPSDKNRISNLYR